MSVRLKFRIQSECFMRVPPPPPPYTRDGSHGSHATVLSCMIMRGEGVHIFKETVDPGLIS
jgi:hypothetical protein